jgi:type II secretory pathway pseudopilin PulG
MIKIRLRNNHHGFSLIETLITIPIMLFLVAGVTNYLLTARHAEDQVRTKKNFLDQVQATQLAMADIQTCTKNFEGLTVSSKPLNISNGIVLRNLASVDTAQTVIVKPDSRNVLNGTMMISNLTLAVKAPVGVDQVLLDLKVGATKVGDALGPAQMSQSIMLYAGLSPTTKKIAFCYGLAEGAIKNVNNQICDKASGGTMYYDLITKECTDRFEEQSFAGTQGASSCPRTSAGLLPGSRGCKSTIHEYKPLPISRTFTDSTVIPAAPPRPYICTPAPDQYHVACEYAVDADASASQCVACCKNDLLPSLIASGHASR